MRGSPNQLRFPNYGTSRNSCAIWDWRRPLTISIGPLTIPDMSTPPPGYLETYPDCWERRAVGRATPSPTSERRLYNHRTCTRPLTQCSTFTYTHGSNQGKLKIISLSSRCWIGFYCCCCINRLSMYFFYEERQIISNTASCQTTASYTSANFPPQVQSRFTWIFNVPAIKCGDNISVNKLKQVAITCISQNVMMICSKKIIYCHDWNSVECL